MASEIKYRITAEDDTKRGTSGAEGNINALGSAVDKLSGIFRAMVAAFSVSKIVDGFQDCVKEFGEAQTGMLRLSAAIKNNPMLNGQSYTNLNRFASEMQKLTGITDDEVRQSEAFLVTMQLTEDQITSVMRAAIDLSATGMVDLNTAVRSLGGSFEGNIGMLSRYVPALRGLTTEQLKAGDAVALVAKQYGGLAQSTAQGIEGQKKLLDRSIEELKESIGGAFAPLVSAGLKGITPIIDDMTRWFDENQGRITSFFSNLPAIAGIAFEGIQKILKKTFTGGGFASIVEGMIRILVAGLGAAAASFGDAIVFAVQSIVPSLVLILKNLTDVLKPDFEKNLLSQEEFNRRLKTDPFSKLQDYKPGGVLNPGTRSYGPYESQVTGYQAYMEAFQKQNESYNAEAKAAYDHLAKNLGELGAKTGANFEKLLAEMGGAATDAFDPFMPIIEEYQKKILGVIDSGVKETKEAVVDGMNKPLARGGVGGMANTNPYNEYGIASWSQQGMIGGDMMSGVMSGLGMFGEKLIGIIATIENVKAILDPVGVILQGFADTISGPVNKALEPVVRLLTHLGKMMGEILLPVIDFLSKAILLAATIIAGIFNAIADAINFLLGWMGVHVSRIDLSAPTTSAADMSGGGTMGGTSQYTAAPVINLTVNIYATAITAGDKIMTLRDLAKTLNDELNAALELG